ncbi:hypothetical protein DPQ25_04600 [Hydrogeniiclostridium mannosilyticum]|uniref:Uncharacterized protein n=1 Tax=Hydrogeniiclostridium mannosilyticum TaxID=2764322 RepID=A0A328UGJ6_9FIRM|nr:hypothetical protein DPQ25_04600 [Hydrogeniiclostridium mannosilyticum]
MVFRGSPLILFRTFRGGGGSGARLTHDGRKACRAGPRRYAAKNKDSRKNKRLKASCVSF